MPPGSRLALLGLGASLLLTAAGAVSGCRRPPRWGTPEFDMQLARHLRAKRCEKAIALVERAAARDDHNWYAWMVELKLDCLAKSGQGHYGDDALRLVHEGIRRFPKSARLVLLKGFAYSRLSERGLSDRYYEEALKLAKANIAESKDGRGNAEDRLVVKDVEQSLGLTPRPTP